MAADQESTAFAQSEWLEHEAHGDGALMSLLVDREKAIDELANLRIIDPNLSQRLRYKAIEESINARKTELGIDSLDE